MDKESRRFDICKRVFTKTDIKRLGQFIDKEYQLAIKQEHHSKSTYQIICKGGISYGSDSLSIFEDNGPLDIKKTHAIEMTFSDYEEDLYISISLREGNNDNTLYVSGTNSTWVNGTFTNLLGLIESVTPQDNFLLRHKTIVFHVISFCIGSLVFTLMMKFYDLVIPPIQNPSKFLIESATFFGRNLWLITIINNILSWMDGLFLALLIRDWLIKLWPDIEFNFGPNHMNIIKVRRQRIWAVMSLVVIPIFINIFV